MKRFPCLWVLFLALLLPSLAQTKTDVIYFEFNIGDGSGNSSLSYQFSEKVLSGIEVEWNDGVNHGRFKPELGSQSMTVYGKGYWRIHYTYNVPTDYTLSTLGYTGDLSVNSFNVFITSLNVSNCTALKELNCPYNHLNSLNVSGCTFLKNLDCSFNQLSSLDVSGCSALKKLNCSFNQLRNLDVNGCTALTSLNCSSNHIPLSILYKAYIQNPSWSTFLASQSDTMVLYINQPFDLSSEKIIGETISTSSIISSGQPVSSDFWTENNFVFQFHKPSQYTMVLMNPAVGYLSSFIWSISVIIPEGHLLVQVASNNSDWGATTITGNGNGTYKKGSEVTITATPNAGYRFVNWTKKDGSVFSTKAVHTFAVTENLELTAHFEQGVGNENSMEDNFYVYSKGHTIYLSCGLGTIQVFDAAGTLVYNGQSTAIPVQHSGMYIVKVGERSFKTIVR